MMKKLFYLSLFLSPLSCVAQEIASPRFLPDEVKIFEKFHENSDKTQKCPEMLDFDFIKLLKKYSGVLSYQLNDERKGINITLDNKKELDGIHTQLPGYKGKLEEEGAKKIEETYSEANKSRSCTYNFPKPFKREGSFTLEVKSYSLPNIGR